MTGTVKLIMDQQTFESGFTKREFVVTTEDDRYPQDIKFECVRDKTALLDGVTAGQRVKVTFDLRGNEYKDRYYVNLTAWRIEEAAAGDGEAVPTEDGPPLEELEPPADDSDDMPF
jgi:hypothetical protein